MAKGTLRPVLKGKRPRLIVKVRCDDRANGGCGRTISEIVRGGNGDVMILGTLEAQNGDSGGLLTARVPGMKVTHRRRDAVVGDTTDPAERKQPGLRTDLIEARRMAHEAGQRFPDGLSYQEGVAAEIAKHEKLLAEWNPAAVSSRTGRRTFACACRGNRVATVSQEQLDAAYEAAIAASRRSITLRNLRQGRPPVSR